MECSHTGLRDVVDDVALLLLEGGGDGEDAFDEATGCGAVGAPAPFAPENRGPQRAFGGVVRGLNAGHVDERPERRPQRYQVPARRRTVPGSHPKVYAITRRIPLHLV
jgi:hypothetical protein